MTSQRRARASLATIGLAFLALVPFTFAEGRPAPRLIRAASFDSAATGGITVGSSVQDVRNLFGRLHDESDGTCFSWDGSGAIVDGVAKQLDYPGFTVHLAQYPGDPDYTTTLIAIHGPNLWVTPGLTVGMSAKSLKSLLGKPDAVGVDGSSGDRIQHYTFSPPGDLRVHLTKGIVSEIEILR